MQRGSNPHLTLARTVIYSIGKVWDGTDRAGGLCMPPLEVVPLSDKKVSFMEPERKQTMQSLYGEDRRKLVQGKKKE